jgi:hypothetical protein
MAHVLTIELSMFIYYNQCCKLLGKDLHVSASIVDFALYF